MYLLWRNEPSFYYATGLMNYHEQLSVSYSVRQSHGNVRSPGVCCTVRMNGRMCQFLSKKIIWRRERILLCAILLAFGPILLALGPSGIHYLTHNAPNLLNPRSFTDTFVDAIIRNGSKTCHHMGTTNGRLSGPQYFGPPPLVTESEMNLSTGEVHKFWIVSYDAEGGRRCNGGDFYETDLSGPNWKSRPPVSDRGDGSYSTELFMEDAAAGTYAFKAILLFTNFHGFDVHYGHKIVDREMWNLKINFVRSRDAQALPSCKQDALTRPKWMGRWTRTKSNESCKIDPVGRYRCLRNDEPCDSPWCDGPLGKLESNGWVYSAHCRFHLWTADEAWECLRGRRLLLWGDSTMQDTIHNILNFILDLGSDHLSRTHTGTYSHPTNSSRSFDVMHIWNGHYRTDSHHVGLGSLYHDDYKAFVERSFAKGRFDTVVLNSGLHDGLAWHRPELFADAATHASKFWARLWKSSKPRMVLKTTVTAAGRGRNKPYNPQKMEAYNNILVEQMRQRIAPLQVIDAYDMTFPWHYDYCCSDGRHYGTMPTPFTKHQYFIDVMLGHTLLNAICQPRSSA